MPVKPIPDGYHRVTPYLIVRGVPRLIEFLKRAFAAEEVHLMAPADQFHGDRYGVVKDPAGNHWCIATHIEDVSPGELARRQKEFIANQARG